jgi:hypothetical protein
MVMHEQVESNQSIESPLTHIFSGRFRSTVHAPNQPNTVTIEDWRSLQLDIQVRFPSFSHYAHVYALMTDVEY